MTQESTLQELQVQLGKWRHQHPQKHPRIKSFSRGIPGASSPSENLNFLLKSWRIRALPPAVSPSVPCSNLPRADFLSSLLPSCPVACFLISGATLGLPTHMGFEWEPQPGYPLHPPSCRAQGTPFPHMAPSRNCQLSTPSSQGACQAPGTQSKCPQDSSPSIRLGKGKISFHF